MPVSMFCEICPDRPAMPTEEAMDHLRVMHPDQCGDGIETWPDGSPVIVDCTLQPGDFA